MDFYRIAVRENKDKTLSLYPDWVVGRSKDLMVRGRSFYAVWDEEAGMWSTDEYDVQRLVDADLQRYAAEHPEEGFQVMNLKSFNTKVWTTFRQYVQNISDNAHQLDESLIFANTEVKKEDYASKRLPYDLAEGDHSAWDELVGTLYSEEERRKIEWAIGAIVSGDSKFIQKFLVFYGPAGSGKSTALSIIERLFDGYVTTFDARALGSSNNNFATEVFRTNPLVAIQHDGDLSNIQDNTKLNSIVSHEMMPFNEKFKATYSARVNAFLFMGTNKPVKISDAKSGLLRRLIDVHPTGVLIEENRYHALMMQVEFELGAIAHHCLKVYEELGRTYYSSYRPKEMMLQTDVFYNFVEAQYFVFRAEDGVSLKRAYELYKSFCAETGIEKLMPQYKFREELRNYFEEFLDRTSVDGKVVRSYYRGFKDIDKDQTVTDTGYSLVLTETSSVFDTTYADQPAQYPAEDENRLEHKWANVKTKLKDIDTSRLHYVQIPEQHIVIDIDLPDEDGEKDLERSMEEAMKWPPTYTELSRSGKGIHLHYIYTGDVRELANVYDTGVEIKTLLGNQSLRRKLTKCNNLAIATISSGLPKKERRPVLDTELVKDEKHLRIQIENNLEKKVHPGTKPSIDFIKKILDDAYESGISYNVLDMRERILRFALHSTNQRNECLKIVQQMKFMSESELPDPPVDEEADIVFFDVEVYPNLLVVCWKYEGSDKVVQMINPSPEEVGEVLNMKLVGFNNRRYDNHILYARYLGWSIPEIYAMSAKIIANVQDALIGAAYNISYTDIYDFSSIKQGLKKFEIQLGIHHMELDLPWDQPVDESQWQRVADYCSNDVRATEAVFNDRKQDFVARQILAELSGLSVNHTTQSHTARIIFGQERNPQRQFVYTDLSEEFKGYKFVGGKEGSTYRGEVTGEGGYVYAEKGVHHNVALLDVASMHPTSIELLNLFGPFTQRFSELKAARLAIKRREYDEVRSLLGGRLSKFVTGDDAAAEELAYALKIVINIVYGLTSAHFDNPFRDIRNKDNIVAKRGALFMIDLKHAVQEQGFTVAHIKTDSIKIPNATPEIIQFVIDFGKKYGYDFEHECTYDRMCLVNDAVYVALYDGKWTAVGAQFQVPYVYKTLFSGEELTFDDFCLTKNVTVGTMYLDFHPEENPDTKTVESMVHVGRTGSFVPVSYGGGVLYRVKDDQLYAVTGTKGYLWVEREVAQENPELQVDMRYFEELKQKAIAEIEQYMHFETFVNEPF